jgi:bacteriocin-like protein
MMRNHRNDERTLKVLSADELRHVIGGTDDPTKPIDDPGEGGGSGGDPEAVAQNWSGRR